MGKKKQVKVRSFEEKPEGRKDNGGRWYPDEQTEYASCCKGIRGPSRAYPWSLWKHCCSKKHYITLCAEKGVKCLLPSEDRKKAGIFEKIGYKALLVVDGQLKSNWEMKNASVKISHKTYVVGKWFREKVTPSHYNIVLDGSHPRSGFFFYETEEECRDYMREYGVKGHDFQVFKVRARYYLAFRRKYVCSMLRLEEKVAEGSVV